MANVLLIKDLTAWRLSRSFLKHDLNKASLVLGSGGS